MDPYSLLLEPSGTRTRLVLTQGPREGLRAVLPPLTHVRHGVPPKTPPGKAIAYALNRAVPLGRFL
jgi:hypothetical protein